MPKLNVQSMTQKVTRQLRTKTVRNMLSMGHAKFFDRLKEKSVERGVVFLEVTEHYTSKTCGRCGEIREDLGSSEVFQCKKCKFCADRDTNAARNILLRAIRVAG